jgi:multiple sugar transport system ATP-binding protein
MASVRVQDVTMRYPGTATPALGGVSLEVADREFFVLLGPSGCGKSTLLKLVAGLEEPDTGRLFLDDELVNFVAPSRRNVAMVFQSYALYPQMNVLQNIAFPLRMRRVPRARRELAAREVAATLGLEPLLARTVAQLSGGQRQRVAVARALVREPRVLLMDEPLSNLDAMLRVEMREELMRVHRETATTVLYVTHDQVEATTMADRIGVMSEGRLEQVGTPDEVFGRPTNTFVARFVGSPPMSFLAGRGGPGPVFEAPDVRLGLPDWTVAALDGRLAGSVPLTLGIRPHAVRLVDPAGADARGHVRLVESLGGEAIVVVEVGGQLVRALVRRDRPPAEGAIVGLMLDAPELHLFDAAGVALR